MQPIATDGIAWSVGQSVCWSVTTVNPVKTAEPIEMPFVTWTPMGLKNCVRWGSDLLHGKGNFWGG